MRFPIRARMQLMNGVRQRGNKMQCSTGPHRDRKGKAKAVYAAPFPPCHAAVSPKFISRPWSADGGASVSRADWFWWSSCAIELLIQKAERERETSARWKTSKWQNGMERESDIKTGRATHAQKLLPPKPTHHSRRQNNQTHLFQCNLLPQPFLERVSFVRDNKLWHTAVPVSWRFHFWNYQTVPISHFACVSNCYFEKSEDISRCFINHAFKIIALSFTFNPATICHR